MKLTSTIFIILLAASLIEAQSLSRERAVKVAQNVSRAFDIYSSRREITRANKHIRIVERELGPIDFDRLDSLSELETSLQNARYGLVRAQLFFKAKMTPRRMTREESELMREMAATEYNCEIEGRDGLFYGTRIDLCIHNVLADVKKNRDVAFTLLNLRRMP